MYDVVIEKTPDGEARVAVAVLSDMFWRQKMRAMIESMEQYAPENEYSIVTAEAIALGNLGESNAT